jgi:ankyrin repeat protein
VDGGLRAAFWIVARLSTSRQKPATITASFMVALRTGNPAVARFLADLKARLDIESAAAPRCSGPTFEESSTARPNPKQVESAFLYACGYGSRAAAEFLRDCGVDPAVRNDDGQTGLQLVKLRSAY